MKACLFWIGRVGTIMSWLWFFPFFISAQDRCGIIDYTEQLRIKKLLKEDDSQFEDWMARRIATRKAAKETTGTYKIPVVVHVIHKGEAVGTAGNITDAQIISQIKTLNKDYNRINTDTVNTPTEFKSVAGKMKVEFVLALQNPDGKATTGIVRVKGTKNQWTTTDDATLKALSYWPAEDYLNIWVTDLSSTLLGYAQFPVSTLDGLEGVDDNRLTDGVVIDYSVFGSDEYGTFSLTSGFTKGRSATHEIGHFLGLRHIWGDVTSCTTTTDYVDDTPKQNASTSGCPSNPQTACSNHKMFQNYMDYTNDPCMNIFTNGQVSRMTTVLESSPRRLSLLSSHGLVDPSPVLNDVKLSEVVSASFNPCDQRIVPQVKIFNAGTNAITTMTLQVKVNSALAETKVFTLDPALEANSEAIVTFSRQSLPSGSYPIDFQVVTTNGQTDGKLSDNSLSFPVVVPFAIDNSFTESFSTLPSTWTIANADQLTTWTLLTAPQGASTNKAAGISFFQSQSASGQQDVLTTPVFDLSNATLPYFSFDVAYATNGSKQDGLKVYVISNCGGMTESGKVYDKSGTLLATAGSQTTAFTPADRSQWRREIISLKDYIGSSRVQLAFVGVNDLGNNLYIDNVSVTPAVKENVAIQRVIHPEPVTCSNSAQPVMILQNRGATDIRSLKINYKVNNGATQVSTTSDDFLLEAGTSAKITLPTVTLSEDLNTLSFEVTEPDGWVDIDPSDNTSSYKTLVNKSTDIIPLRENFDSGILTSWASVNPRSEMMWEAGGTNYNLSLSVKAAANPLAGDEAWLVTPVLDMTTTSLASVFFDVGYHAASASGSMSDSLKVMASLDCGQNFTTVLYAKDLKEIARGTQTGTWTPAAKSDWRRNYVNLNSLTGQGQVRLAFVFVHGQNSDTYLDNIEFFASDNPSPAEVGEPFYIYSNESHREHYITFNLEERQTVAYELLDVAGRSVASEQLPDVLNQTYPIGLNYVSAGIYLLRLQIGNERYVQKILIGN